MWWNIAIFCVWVGLAATIVATIVSFTKKKTGITKPINVFFAGIVVSTFLGLLPTNYIAEGLSENKFIRVIETISLSLANVMQVFTVDMDGKGLLETISKQEMFYLQQPYIITMSILCTVAPLLTVGVLATVLMSLSARRRYLFSFFKPAYIFSELNERSLTLATSIKNNHSNSVIVFTDVIDKDEESFLDLSNRAKSIGSILFKEDILSQKFQLHKKGTEIVFFIIGDNETENISHTLSLLDKFKDRESTKLYLFSLTKESELALTKTERGKVKVYRVNEVRSLIYRTLYEKGNVLFENATPPDENGLRHINAIILGMGNYGTEMTKALSWFCQMDGYKLSIHAFDKDKKAESKFKAMCPDLLSETYNGSDKGEADYSIKIHSDYDINTSELIDFLINLKNEHIATFVFISLGSDEENIKAAVNMRMIWKRIGANPVIQTVIKSANVSAALKNAIDRRRTPYDIAMIGDIESSYTEDVIIKSELESIAKERHMKWGADEQSFWDYEYNYNSSVASVIHRRARNNCGIDGTDILSSRGVDALSDSQKDALQRLEHRRWNAYMRSEGYLYGETPRELEEITRTHHDLKSYDDLPEDEKKKDLW